MENAMSYQSRQEFLRTQRPRYQKASRAVKKRILDEGCEMFGVHRKSLIRALSAARGRPRQRAGRPRRYGAELVKPLKNIWMAAKQPCSKRLAVLMPHWLPHYDRHFDTLPPGAREALACMSPATMDRLLAPIRAQARKGKSGTSSTNRLQGQIPIRTRFQDVEGPGWMEADTVAHCGQSLAGAFVWSLTLTDISSGWTENRAVWNKKHHQIVKCVQEIERGLPFELLGFDSDNGSEFITHLMWSYLRERCEPVDFTRSRPYRKNDNAHVEQRQWTHVRQLLGYDRLEDKRLVALINDLYAHEWRALQNFFLPTVRLVSKSRDGGHLSRRHSAPRTPYWRLMQSSHVSEENKARLRAVYEGLDPFALSRAVEGKLRAIFRMARGNAGKKVQRRVHLKSEPLEQSQGAQA